MNVDSDGGGGGGGGGGGVRNVEKNKNLHHIWRSSPFSHLGTPGRNAGVAVRFVGFLESYSNWATQACLVRTPERSF